MVVQFRIPENIQKEGIITSIHAYRYNKMKTIIANLLIVVTFGLVYLFMNWSLNFWLWMKCDETDQINLADFCVVRTEDNQWNMGELEQKQFKIREEKRFYTILKFRFYRYYFDSEEQEFVMLSPGFSSMSYKEISEQLAECREEDWSEVREKFGENETKIPKKSNKEILFEEIITPFYLFQFLSCLLWYFTDYGTYATFIMVVTVFSMGEALYDYKKQYKKMRRISKNEGSVQVYKQGVFKNQQLEWRDDVSTPEQVENRHLLPGQLIQVSNNLVLPCDAVLVKGQCVLNEAILTGESIPILKTQIPPQSTELYSLEKDGKKHTLFSGTKVLEVKSVQNYPTIAMVTSTGFNTLKGSLIRSILYTIQSYLQFYKDAFKFIAVLALMTVIAFFISLPAKISIVIYCHHGRVHKPNRGRRLLADLPGHSGPADDHGAACPPSHPPGGTHDRAAQAEEEAHLLHRPAEDQLGREGQPDVLRQDRHAHRGRTAHAQSQAGHRRRVLGARRRLLRTHLRGPRLLPHPHQPPRQPHRRLPRPPDVPVHLLQNPRPPGPHPSLPRPTPPPQCIQSLHSKDL